MQVFIVRAGPLFWLLGSACKVGGCGIFADYGRYHGLQKHLPADGNKVAGAAEHYEYMPDGVGVTDFFTHVENSAEGIKKTADKQPD